jgi:hypothetical protein
MVVELVMIEVDVVVSVVEEVVLTVGEKVVVVVNGGVETATTPNIALAGDPEPTRTPTVERMSTRPSRSSR